MKEYDRDISIIEKIIKYCNQIEEAHQRFDSSFEKFKTDSLYHNAVCLCLMQIGELTNHLSENFKAAHADIPWNAIRGMRNIVAHEYGNIDFEIVWETASVEIKDLCDFCMNITKNF